MIGWPPVEPTHSQQRAWIRRQTPNMKCPFYWYVDVSLGKTCVQKTPAKNALTTCKRTYLFSFEKPLQTHTGNVTPVPVWNSCNVLQQNNSGKCDRNGRSSAPPLLKLWDLFQALGVTEVQVEIQLRVLRATCEERASTVSTVRYRLCLHRGEMAIFPQA